jgi:hypothetical protein
MAYQIGLFCMPQLADAECPKADQIGGFARYGSGAATTFRGVRRTAVIIAA